MTVIMAEELEALTGESALFVRTILRILSAPKGDRCFYCGVLNPQESQEEHKQSMRHHLHALRYKLSRVAETPFFKGSGGEFAKILQEGRVYLEQRFGGDPQFSQQYDNIIGQLLKCAKPFLRIMEMSRQIAELTAQYDILNSRGSASVCGRDMIYTVMQLVELKAQILSDDFGWIETKYALFELNRILELSRSMVNLEMMPFELTETTKVEECPICLDMALYPHKTPCGHTFCKFCIVRWLSAAINDSECPICRSVVPLR